MSTRGAATVLSTPFSAVPGGSRGPGCSLEGLAQAQAQEAGERVLEKMQLEQRPVSLVFKDCAVEGAYLSETSTSRWPVLVVIFVFDCSMYLARFAMRLASHVVGGRASVREVASSFVAQLLNMCILYVFMGLLNWRSRRSHSLRAAKQEEVLLALLMAAAISMLLLSLKPHSPEYVYAAFFLICATPLLKIRWLVGTATLAAPVVLAAVTALRGGRLAAAAAAAGEAGTCASGGGAGLSMEAVVHLVVAWAVGGLMSYLLDTSRRQAYAQHTLALAAAEKELVEMRARAGVERELAAAQAQAAARALVVAREKASNEAKSEFMSLMCHEVRTPLNGCLASAEMLLDTDLTAEQHDLARTIRVSGSILLSTVSNFLDFFKMEAGKQLDIVRTPLDIRNLVADVHCIIEAMIGRDGAVSLLEPDLSGVPATVMGDPNRVCGILLNLYTNAAKFTKQGAIGLRARVVGESYRPDVEGAQQFHHAALGSGGAGANNSDSDALASTSLSSSPDSSDNEGQSCGGAGGTGPGEAAGAILARRMSLHQQHCSSPGGRRRGSVGLQDAAPSPRQAGSGSDSQPGSASYRQARPSRQYELQWHSAGGDGEGEETAALAALPSKHSLGSRGGGSRPGSKLATPGRTSTAGPVPLGTPGTAGFMRSSAEFDSAQSLPAAALLAQTVAEEGSAAAAGGSMELVHLGNGWTSVCSRPAAPDAPLAATAAASEGEEAGERLWLVFEVHDTGAGVASRGMDSLFQDYVQGTELEMRRERSRGGTGLGLSICSKQVAVLGGQIGALSKPNCGSVFWFTIPLRIPAGAAAAAEAAPAADDVSAPAAPAVAAAAAAATVGGSPRFSRQSLEAQLTNMWAGGGDAHSVEGTDGSGGRRTSMGSGSRLSTAGHGNSFGWYHLPPAGGAGRTAANRLRGPEVPAAEGAMAVATAGTAAGDKGKAGEAGASGPTAAAAALSRQAGQFAHAGRGYGLWVLLAEDNLINQTVARKMLSALGMKCQVASNGREAVDAVQRAHESGMNFDCVLMDMSMPILSGVDATKAIRQLGCTTPIVAMTANASERDRQECLAAGMNGFLSKPVLKDRLLEAIMAAAEGGQEA